jgi:hypothetical protein
MFSVDGFAKKKEFIKTSSKKKKIRTSNDPENEL